MAPADRNDEVHAHPNVCSWRGALKAIQENMANIQKAVTDDAIRSGANARDAETEGAVAGAAGVIPGVMETVSTCIADGQAKRKNVANILDAKRRKVVDALHKP